MAKTALKHQDLTTQQMQFRQAQDLITRKVKELAEERRQQDRNRYVAFPATAIHPSMFSYSFEVIWHIYKPTAAQEDPRGAHGTPERPVLSLLGNLHTGLTEPGWLTFASEEEAVDFAESLNQARIQREQGKGAPVLGLQQWAEDILRPYSGASW